MPNVIDANGLQTKTMTELINEYVAAMEAIYGTDISLESDTPDGQLMMLHLQSVIDILDLIRETYSSFDPDQAIGVVLDQRVAINGIIRKSGTYSITDVTVVATQALNLSGLDDPVNETFTVADNAGTRWNLVSSFSFSGPGTQALSFQAEEIGQVLTIPNTINKIETIVLGVQSVNNPNHQTSVGLNEETDAQLRQRRRRSVSINSQGYYQALKSALEDLNGVLEARVEENDTDATNSDGVPEHSIWVIIDGAADPFDVADTIYRYRNAGCGTFGTVVYNYERYDGSFIDLRWDWAGTETLYIEFTAQSIDGENNPNYDAIKSDLPNIISLDLFDTVTTNDLIDGVKDIDPNTLVLDGGFSLAPTGPFTPSLQPASKSNKFSLTSNNIIIYPILVLPESLIIQVTATQQFEAKGGYEPYVWSFVQNNSGGSIDPGTGEYTAGATPATDEIRCTDDNGNFTNVTITVVS